MVNAAVGQMDDGQGLAGKSTQQPFSGGRGSAFTGVFEVQADQGLLCLGQGPADDKLDEGQQADGTKS